MPPIPADVITWVAFGLAVGHFLGVWHQYLGALRRH